MTCGSIRCAAGFAAQALAKRSGYRAAEEAFVAGLLHDLGKVVLNLYLTKLFATVAGRAETQHVAFMDAERSVLGFDHAQAGAQVLEKWNLPPVLVSAVRWHHAPLSETPAPTPLTALVHVADVVCLLLGVGMGGDGLQYPLQEGVLNFLRLTEDDVECVAAEVSEACSHSDQLFGV